jgi:hypothetical protein
VLTIVSEIPSTSFCSSESQRFWIVLCFVSIQVELEIIENEPFF